MPMTSVHCAILGANVTRLTDFEGHVTHLICPEYDEAADVCRIRQDSSGGGPLSQLLERASDAALDQRGLKCPLTQ